MGFGIKRRLRRKVRKHTIPLSEMPEIPDLERPWFTMQACFQAISEADAESLAESMMGLLCRGHGEGDDHECRFAVVVAMREMTPHDLHCGCDEEGGLGCNFQ